MKNNDVKTTLLDEAIKCREITSSNFINFKLQDKGFNDSLKNMAKTHETCLEIISNQVLNSSGDASMAFAFEKTIIRIKLEQKIINILLNPTNNKKKLRDDLEGIMIFNKLAKEQEVNAWESVSVENAPKKMEDSIPPSFDLLIYVLIFFVFIGIYRNVRLNINKNDKK